MSVKQERRVSSAAAIVSAPSLFLLRCSRSNKVTALCHGAHTREEQEHADEDLNSNNSL